MRNILEALKLNNFEFTSGNKGYTKWIDEIVWREFYRNIMHSFPKVSKGMPFQDYTRKIVWRLDNWGNDVIDIHFNVPNPPLLANLETSLPVSEDNINSLGFMIYDNGTEINLRNVTLYDSFVRINTSGADRLTSGILNVTYGDPKNSGSGNLCDSDRFLAKSNFVSGVTLDTRTPNYYDGTSILNNPYPLYNYCVPFSYTITGYGEIEIDH